MKLLKRDIFLADVLIIALLTAMTGSAADSTQPASTAAAKTVTRKKVMPVMISAEESTRLLKQINIYEHAAANRELAALTQMEEAGKLAEDSDTIATQTVADETITYESIQNSAGAKMKSAGLLYGYASLNFDAAAASRVKAATLCKKLGKLQLQRASLTYAGTMTAQANNAMQLAANAYENAAVYFDKADQSSQMALCSQTAAVWLEKLVTR